MAFSAPGAKERSRLSEEGEFYREYNEVNPAIILLLILITCGLYIIYWILKQNRNLEDFYEDAPDTNRGFALMVTIPISWTITFVIIKINNFWDLYPEFLLFVQVFIWTIIILLILKFLFDFCVSFAKFTKSNALVWFFLILLGIIGILGIPIKSFLITPFAFFLAITIPAMQEEINHVYTKNQIKNKSDAYYDC